MSGTNVKVDGEISRALSYALSKGYQVTPQAMELLQRYVSQKTASDTTIEVDAILSLVIEEKARATLQEGNKQIDKADLLMFAIEGFGDVGQSDPVSTASMKQTEDMMEILSDPSNAVEPAGIDGFSQLFKSRYEKLMNILRQRPESRQLL